MEKHYKNRVSSILTAFIIGAITLASCISQKNVKLIQERVNKEPASQFVNSRASAYRIQIGDNIYVRVYSVDPKTSKFFQSDFPYLMNSTYQYLNTYVVDEFGYISFSFIEKLYVKGLSIPEMQQAIQTQLDQYFKDATVYVKLVNYQVGILGEVNSPGNFTIEQDQITLFQAIGLAGGLTDFGNFKAVKLIRQTQDGSAVYLLDITDNKILESPYFYLMPNDVVYIEPRNVKSWAYSQFPYQTLLSFLSVAIVGVALFIK
jgi:polysaccharide export outer membrane protein